MSTVEFITALFYEVDEQMGGHCQVVGAETPIRQAGASAQSYLPLRQPAPCLSLRPNSRNVSSSPGGSQTPTTDASVAGSVGR